MPPRPPACRSSTAVRPSRHSRRPPVRRGSESWWPCSSSRSPSVPCSPPGCRWSPRWSASATGMAGVFALTTWLDLTSTAPTLGLMVGLAVGIDYALFITTRHRENLAAGLDPREAAGRAVGTAGSAVVFAGATVMIALAALSVVGIPFLTTMGLVAAGMVAIAVLVALTLVPAFLGFAGGRFDRWPIPGLRGRQARLGTRPSFGSRWARAIVRRPVAFLLVAIVGARRGRAARAEAASSACPTTAPQPTATTQRQAYDLLAEGFGPGFNGPLTVVVDGTRRPDRSGDRRPRPAASGARRRRGGHSCPDQPGRRHRDHHRHPAERTVRQRDQGPGDRHPRPPRRHRVADRRRHPGHRQHRGRHRHLRQARRAHCPSSCCWSSGCPSSCSRSPSGRSWCRSRPPWASCSASRRRSVRSSRSSSGAGSSACSASTAPARSSASCRSCSSACSSGWPWTTRSSSSAGCARTTSTATARRRR